MAYADISAQGTAHIKITDTAGQFVYPIAACFYQLGYLANNGATAPAGLTPNPNELTFVVQIGDFNKTLRLRPTQDTITVSGTPAASTSALLTALAVLFA
jgi:hypothetical protein